MDYQLSILLPSAHKDKRERFIQNLRETLSDFNSVEIVICLDGDLNTWRDGNIVYCYSPPSKYRSSFFECAWKNSTGRFVLMANDDILFKTLNWDLLIPYDKYPDDLVVFGFRDSQFNENFFCHPVWSRKVMNLGPELLEPSYQITKCDNTIWDIHPPNRRVYLYDIVLEHKQDPYDLKIWQNAYDEDNATYIDNTNYRVQIRNKILKELGMTYNKVMIGIVTAEYARRADFYDHFSIMDRPPNSIYTAVHAQSIAANRNLVVDAALKNNCTHVFFLDDDVICKPNIIWKLLEHNKDIVCGLQLKRNHPHYPLIFVERLETKFRIPQLHELIPGLNPIVAAGLGCILIKTDVFKKMKKPYFRMGEITLDQIQEDTGFFNRLPSDVESYCDVDSPVGHIASMVVRPKILNGQLGVDLDTNGDGSISFVPVKSIRQEPKLASIGLSPA